MCELVDARGLSCPMPVMAAAKKMAELGRGRFEMLVDTDTARENVARLAGREGWGLEQRSEKEGVRLILIKD